MGKYKFASSLFAIYFVVSSFQFVSTEPPVVQSSNEWQQQATTSIQWQEQTNSGWQEPQSNGWEVKTNNGWEAPASAGWEEPVSTGWGETPVNSGWESEAPQSSGWEEQTSSGWEAPASTGWEAPANNGWGWGKLYEVHPNHYLTKEAAKKDKTLSKHKFLPSSFFKGLPNVKLETQNSGGWQSQPAKEEWSASASSSAGAWQTKGASQTNGWQQKPESSGWDNSAPKKQLTYSEDLTIPLERVEGGGWGQDSSASTQKPSDSYGAPQQEQWDTSSDVKSLFTQKELEALNGWSQDS